MGAESQTNPFNSSLVQVCKQIPQHIPTLRLQEYRPFTYPELPQISLQPPSANPEIRILILLTFGSVQTDQTRLSPSSCLHSFSYFPSLISRSVVNDWPEGGTNCRGS